MVPFGVVRFWLHVSVGVIHFEDGFSASRKGGIEEVGGSTTLPDSAW